MQPRVTAVAAIMFGTCFLSPAFGQPNGRIAYVLVQNSAKQLRILDLATGISSHVSLPDVRSPAWSRDGAWLAFGIGDTTGGRINTARPDGSDLFDVTHSPYGGEPSFSGDASEIVFYAISGGWRIHTVNSDGTNRINLGISGVHVRWSPVEDKLAYSNWATIPLPYQSDIFVYDRTTGMSTQITAHAANHGFVRAAWSPDGLRFAVTEVDHGTGKQDLWVMNSDGSNPVNVTGDWTTSSEGYPSWSSDGEYIIFSSDRSGNLDIWAMRPDGSERVNLTNTPEDEFSPSIGPAAVEDFDGDGVPDDDDACPDSDFTDTIVIDACDTDVLSELLDDGCTMADWIGQCATSAVNNAVFVCCVAHLTNEWKASGLIVGADKGAIQSCAAQADEP